MSKVAAENWRMVGVQYMISGAIGKLGQTYTIDIKCSFCDNNYMQSVVKILDI